MAFLYRITRSIVARLLLLALFMLALSVLVRYFSLLTFLREDLLGVESAQQEALARDMARDVDYKIAERQNLLLQMARTLPLDLLLNTAQLSEWLALRHEMHPVFTGGIFVANLQGGTIADYPRVLERKEQIYADRDYFQGALAGHAMIGRAVMGRALNEPVLPMAVPVKDASGRIRAILVGITKLNSPGFLDEIQQGHIGKTGGYLLISPRDEIFIAATKPELTLKPTARPGVNPLHDRAIKGFRGSGITTNAQGVEELSAMASVPSTGWFVVARLPTDEALALISHVKVYLVRYTVLALIFIVTVLYLCLTWFFRPLVRAAEQANRMTSGELPMQPLVVSRDDEIGQLTTAFNRLMQKLLYSQKELAGLVRKDVLTGLSNRLHLLEKMQEALAWAQRRECRLAILYLDLDGFKPVNDEFGHEAGDMALAEVARRLSSIVRQVDTLARVGGDEFVIVMEGLEGDLTATEMAVVAVSNKCIAAIQQPMMIKGKDVQLDVSIGIAVGNGSSSVEALMSSADNAMYAAKKAGRGRHVMAECLGQLHSVSKIAAC